MCNPVAAQIVILTSYGWQASDGGDQPQPRMSGGASSAICPQPWRDCCAGWGFVPPWLHSLKQSLGSTNTVMLLSGEAAEDRKSVAGLLTEAGSPDNGAAARIGESDSYRVCTSDQAQYSSPSGVSLASRSLGEPEGDLTKLLLPSSRADAPDIEEGHQERGRDHYTEVKQSDHFEFSLSTQEWGPEGHQ